MNPEGADTDFSWERADELTRAGLLGQMANPVHRVATLLWRRFEGRIDRDVWGTEANGHHSAAERAVQEIGALFREARLREAVSRIHDLGRTVNQRLAGTEPWYLPQPEAHRVLTTLLPYLDALGLAAHPVVPETAGRIRTLLGRAAAPTVWSLDRSPPLIRREPDPPLRFERGRDDR